MFDIALGFSPSYYDWQLDGERWTAIFTTSKANWAFFTTWIWQVARQVQGTCKAHGKARQGKSKLVAYSCPTLRPLDCTLPGSSVHGILQARILEWVAVSSSRNLPHPGIKLGSPASQTDSLWSEPPGKPNCLLIADTQIGGQYPVLLVDFCLAPIIALCLH